MLHSTATALSEMKRHPVQLAIATNEEKKRAISNHDDQAILHEAKYSLENRLKHSIKVVRESLGDKLLSQLKARFLKFEALKFNEEALQILENDIVKNWDHKHDADVRRNDFEKKLEKLILSHLENAYQNQDITLDMKAAELESFLQNIKSDFLKQFPPLSDFDKISKECTKQLFDTQSILNSTPKLPKSKKLQALTPKIKELSQWQTVLSKDEFQESSFKQLFNRKNFFTYKEQCDYEDKTFGNTPLHFCALYEDYSLAEALMKLTKKCKNKNGYLPFHFAIRKCHDLAIQFLELFNPSREELIAEDPEHRQALKLLHIMGI